MKYLPNEDHIDTNACNGQRPVYEPPTIIYEGVVSTRAGSPFGGNPDSDGGVDPADLFGE